MERGTIRGPAAMLLVVATAWSSVAAQGEAQEAVVSTARALLDKARAALAAADVVAARQAAFAGIDLVSEIGESDPSDEVCALLESLGLVARDAGGPARARVALQRAVEIRTAAAAGDTEDPRLVTAQSRLALTLYYLEDLDGARALQENVLAIRERTLPEDHPDLTEARNNLALTLLGLGEYGRARALQEAVLRADEKALDNDHPDLLLSRLNLAATFSRLGDLTASRALEEAVVASYERTVPEGHPMLLRARNNLAMSHRRLGNYATARLLQEAVLADYERIFPPDHPNTVIARQNLSITLDDLGEVAAARQLAQSVLEFREKTLPAGHPYIAVARNNLAVTLTKTDLDAACALQKKALEEYEKILPADHRSVVFARGNLAVALMFQDRPKAARPLFESVLAAREANLPAGHERITRPRSELAWVFAALGEFARARDLLPAIARETLSRLHAVRGLSAREASQRSATEGYYLDWILFLSAIDAPQPKIAFEVAETRRFVSLPVEQRVVAGPEAAALRASVVEARRRLNDAVAGGLGENWRREIVQLTRERDRCEEAWNRKLVEAGAFTGAIGVESVAAALGQGEAAVGFLRYVGLSVDPESKRVVREDRVLAHVVRADGTLARVDLGPAAALEERVAAWRSALGKPVERGLSPRRAGGEREAGEALRRALLDPVLAAATSRGASATLIVCPDDLAYLVPLDALPLGDGCVGDRHRISQETSFASVIAPPAPPTAEPSLLAVGGVRFDAAAGQEQGSAGSGERGGSHVSFEPLLQTLLEAETVGLLFGRTSQEKASLLLAEDATKAAVRRAAASVRYLHVATHGWFAPETVASTADARPDVIQPWRSSNVNDTLAGLAPMTLCGLALAGANGGRDAFGRVPGILTAEELAGFDLTQCELAVLSACETNVGIRRAGQGIQSLQAALRAAGARATITSLWKVDDAATRRLMERFYTKLWVEKKPKAVALWEAKVSLRREGAPTRDWAAWVLSGDPR